MMLEIAETTNKSPEIIAKQMGKEMKNSHKVTVRGQVAVIPVTGPLFRYANLMTSICGATSYELLARDFNKAVEDPNITGIVLDIDSPGGEVNGCSELSDMIFEARGKKPIIAYASGACCSGAYWIASSCDKILATDTAILGSIGVVATYGKEDDDKTIEIVSSQSPNKRPNISTDEGKAKIQTRIDDLASVFISKIARNKEISTEEVMNNFGGGDVFVGKIAVRNGLADGLSSLEEVISSLNNSQSMENTFMNKNINIEDIKATERQRMADVFASNSSKGVEATAQMLLSKTDLPATDILMILETVPKAKENPFEKVMAGIKNPEITPANDIVEESADSIARRITGEIK